MDGKIVRAWESPPNSESEMYEVGTARHSFGHPSWTVGCISEDGHADGRVCIYDTNDNLRVSLPVQACAVEYE